MSPCIICFLRGLYGVQHASSEHHPASSELAAELEDSRKFALSAVMPLFAVIVASGSRTLWPVILVILVCVIGLRMATTRCSLERYPTLFRFLHVMPLIAICCTAGTVLVLTLKSPGLATAGIVLGVSPLATLAIHFRSRSGERPEPVLPMHVQDIPTPDVTSVDDAMSTVESNENEGVSNEVTDTT